MLCNLCEVKFYSSCCVFDPVIPSVAAELPMTTEESWSEYNEDSGARDKTLIGSY